MNELCCFLNPAITTKSINNACMMGRGRLDAESCSHLIQQLKCLSDETRMAAGVQCRHQCSIIGLQSVPLHGVQELEGLLTISMLTVCMNHYIPHMNHRGRVLPLMVVTRFIKYQSCILNASALAIHLDECGIELIVPHESSAAKIVMQFPSRLERHAAGATLDEHSV